MNGSKTGMGSAPWIDVTSLIIDVQRESFPGLIINQNTLGTVEGATTYYFVLRYQGSSGSGGAILTEGSLYYYPTVQFTTTYTPQTSPFVQASFWGTKCNNNDFTFPGVTIQNTLYDSTSLTRQNIDGQNTNPYVLVADSSSLMPGWQVDPAPGEDKYFSIFLADGTVDLITEGSSMIIPHHDSKTENKISL